MKNEVGRNTWGRKGVVLHRKGGFENVAVAITDQCDVFTLGIVEGDAEDLAGIPGALENRPDEHVLITIDRCNFGLFGSLHGTTMMPCRTPSKSPPKQSGELKP